MQQSREGEDGARTERPPTNDIEESGSTRRGTLERSLLYGPLGINAHDTLTPILRKVEGTTRSKGQNRPYAVTSSPTLCDRQTGKLDLTVTSVCAHRVFAPTGDRYPPRAPRQLWQPQDLAGPINIPPRTAGDELRQM